MAAFLRWVPGGARFPYRELLFSDFYSLDLFVVDRTVILDLKGITLSVLAEIDAVGYECEEVTGLCFQNDVITVFTKLCNLADKCVDLSMNDYLQEDWVTNVPLYAVNGLEFYSIQN